jgi:hypothetical protein
MDEEMWRDVLGEYGEHTPKGWFDAQPEPSSDCNSEEDHYVALLEFGECPNCGQKEVPMSAPEFTGIEWDRESNARP